MSAGMLKDILDAERNARLALANEKAAIAVEHAAIVAGIHAEFDKHMPELSGLMLIGDYGRPVPIKLGGGFRAGKNDHGITIDLGKTIGSEQLELRITRRSADTAPIASLQHCRSYPYKNDPPSVAPGHSPAETLVRGLLNMLVKHIHMGE